MMVRLKDAGGARARLYPIGYVGPTDVSRLIEQGKPRLAHLQTLLEAELQELKQSEDDQELARALAEALRKARRAGC